MRERARGRERSSCAPQSSNFKGFAGTRNLTFGVPGRGAPKPLFHQPTREHPTVSMSGDPRTNTDHWAACPVRAAPSAQEDLDFALQAARAPPNAARRGRRGPAPSTLTPRCARAAARALSYDVAPAPHTRRERANMRAALIVAQELLRCGLAESGCDALLERIAELLDAASRGTPPFCSLPMPQVVFCCCRRFMEED